MLHTYTVILQFSGQGRRAVEVVQLDDQTLDERHVLLNDVTAHASGNLHAELARHENNSFWVFLAEEAVELDLMQLHDGRVLFGADR